MGNLNDYGLPQMKRLLGDTSIVNDAIYLPFVHQAVYEVDSSLADSMVVTVTGSSYALTPAPVATSVIWNVLANGAVLLYLEDKLRDFQDELEGLDSVRDDVTTYSRRDNLKEKRMGVEAQQKKYNKAVSDYKRLSGDGGSTMDEIALREDA